MVGLGSFVLSKYLLVKTLKGPFGSLTFIRKALGVTMVDEMPAYSGSFTSELLMCHNCLAPYAAAAVTIVLALILSAPVSIAIGAWVTGCGINIILFDALDLDYE